MDWEHLSAGWSQYGDRVREQWSKLTDEDLAAIAGDYDRLIDTIQLRYGVQREQAELELVEWLEVLKIRG
jgi:uncharacterized protein YjbJ (UPF0337 family)